MSFSDLGYEKAQLEIQQHEEQSPLAIQSEVKPFTTKAPVHVIEALDTVAEEFGMSRNAFVLKLLEVYLGSAYVDYQNGYGDSFNEDPHVFPVSQLEKLIKKTNPSLEAQQYLERTVFQLLECLNYWEKNNDQIRGNSIKRLYSTRRNKQERRSL